MNNLSEETTARIKELTESLESLSILKTELEKVRVSNSSFNSIPEGAVVQILFDGVRSYRVDDDATPEQRNSALIVELVDISTNKTYQGSLLAFGNALTISDDSIDVGAVADTNDAHESSKISSLKSVLLNAGDIHFLRIVKSIKMTNWNMPGIPTGKDKFMYPNKLFRGYDEYIDDVTGAQTLVKQEKYAALNRARKALYTSGLVDGVKESDCLTRPLFSIVE